MKLCQYKPIYCKLKFLQTKGLTNIIYLLWFFMQVHNPNSSN